MVLGLYYDQFEKLTGYLTKSKLENKDHIRVMVILEKKRVISDFFEIMRTKNIKIAEKGRPGGGTELRYFSRPQQSPE